MSAFLSFSESKKSKLPDWTGQMRSGTLGTLVGLLLLFVSLSVFIPSDTYSTARWFDNLNVNQAIAGTVSWFSPWNPIPVSREAFFFSVFVSAANLALAYQAAFGGYWFDGEPDANLFTVIKHMLSGKGGGRKINMVKVGYFVILMGVTLFETATGMEFRQKDNTWDGALKAAAVAFVVENAGSDWALTGGIGMVLGGLMQIYDAWVMGRNDILAISAALKGRTPRPAQQGQPQGQAKQPQNSNGYNPQLPKRPQNSNGGQPKHNGGSQPSYGNPVRPAQGQGQRHQGNNNGSGHQPQRPQQPIRPATEDELYALLDGMEDLR